MWVPGSVALAQDVRERSRWRDDASSLSLGAGSPLFGVQRPRFPPEINSPRCAPVPVGVENGSGALSWTVDAKALGKRYRNHAALSDCRPISARSQESIRPASPTRHGGRDASVDRDARECRRLADAQGRTLGRQSVERVAECVAYDPLGDVVPVQ